MTGPWRVWADANLKMRVPRLESESEQRATLRGHKEVSARDWPQAVGHKIQRHSLWLLPRSAPAGPVPVVYYQVWSHQPMLAREEEQWPSYLMMPMHCRSLLAPRAAPDLGWLAERSNNLATETLEAAQNSALTSRETANSTGVRLQAVGARMRCFVH